jgi:hypothetical protein
MKLELVLAFFLKFIAMAMAFKLEAMSNVINDLIEELFIKHKIHFDIMIYGNTSHRSLDLLNTLLKKNERKYAEQIEIQPKLGDHKIYKSALIFVENEKILNQLTMKSRLESLYPHRIRFLMYCESLDTTDILALPTLNDGKGLISMFQFFLANSTSSVDLYTFEWYTKEKCNAKQLIKLNSFSKKSQKWNKNLSIDEKFKNFHGCMLTVRLGENYMMTNIDRTSLEPFGPIVDLFKAMAHVGNFTYNYQMIRIHITQNYEKVIENIPRNGMVVKHDAFFQMAVFMFSAVAEQLHFITLFKEEKVSCLLTPGEPYDSYEKLLFPFDFWTWMCLLVVFGCTFGSIIVINLLPRCFQNLFYGEHVMTPALNVGAIFFGISQTQLPFKNFPRIILVTFVLFCLVMRTAYQGVLFELIAAAIRKPIPKTFYDLYTRNYSIQASDMIETQMKEMISTEER